MRGILLDVKVAADAKSTYERLTDSYLPKESIRLLPYIQYVLMNEQKFDRSKMSTNEMSEIRRLVAEGHLRYGDSGRIRCTVDFWRALNDVLFYSYVNYKEEK